MQKFPLTALAALLLATTPALADDVLSGENAIVKGNLCAGEECTDPETYSDASGTLRLKAPQTQIEFIDTSDPAGIFPGNDWRIVANENIAGGANFLGFEDLTGSATPFKIMAGAPENALFVSSSGSIGVGTSLPNSQTVMHLESPLNYTSLRIEGGTGSKQRFDLSVRGNGFDISRVTPGGGFAMPFSIRSGAPTASLNVSANGDIGLGTSLPEGKLHTKGDGVQLAYFESTDGNAVQVRFRTDSENRRFLAVNNANEVKSQIVFGDNQIQFLGETVAQEWLRISSAGIVSSGPTCNPNPCDRTFDRDFFTVPAIEERAAYMWENMHLPAVGPTAPEAPFNVTEKLGGVIHELEVAHIYIEQLHDRLEAEASRNDAQEALNAELLSRLEALETH